MKTAVIPDELLREWRAQAAALQGCVQIKTLIAEFLIRERARREGRSEEEIVEEQLAVLAAEEIIHGRASVEAFERYLSGPAG